MWVNVPLVFPDLVSVFVEERSKRGIKGDWISRKGGKMYPLVCLVLPLSVDSKLPEEKDKDRKSLARENR
jgi:hypothetical protein